MEDYYWFVLDIKNNKVVNAFEEEYKEDAKEYIEMETEGDKEYRKNFKIISKRTKEKLGYEYPATTKKDAKGGKIMKTYDDFGRDYDKFTDYVMDRITLEDKRKIRKDWKDTGGKMKWQDYLLKRVNEKSYGKEN